jgi:hypothetical protein
MMRVRGRVEYEGDVMLGYIENLFSPVHERNPARFNDR